MGSAYRCLRRRHLILFYLAGSIGLGIGGVINFYYASYGHNLTSNLILFLIYIVLTCYLIMKYLYSKKNPVAELYPGHVNFYISPFKNQIQIDYDNVSDVSITKYKIKIEYEINNRKSSITLYQYHFEYPEDSFSAIKGMVDNAKKK